MLTVEELMKLRYKVVADYPAMNCEVGDIFIEYVWDTGGVSYVTNPQVLLAGNNMKANVISAYPHLFRKLEWYEYRQEKDMPEYVKFETETHFAIGKIKRILQGGHGEPIVRLHNCKFDCNLHYCLPATAAEYNAYIKTKQ